MPPAPPYQQLGPDAYAANPNPSTEQRAAADKAREEQAEHLTRWWLDRMTVADHQALEKLIFFWHGHWSTSIRKVKSPQLMLAQHRTLRSAPNFADMARRMVVDPALVHWLDGQFNTRKAPNENLARELCELFMLGLGRYTEADVKEAGRALTGWRLDLQAERVVLDPNARDTGSKTVLGAQSELTARSLVDLMLRQSACAEFIASRLWFRYASATQPMPPRVREAMAAAFPAPLAMLRALFVDEAFLRTRGTMVKQPVEWLVGTMRSLGPPPRDDARVETFTQILWAMDGLGQRLFAPPSVGGWPAGAAWLTSAAALSSGCRKLPTPSRTSSRPLH